MQWQMVLDLGRPERRLGLGWGRGGQEPEGSMEKKNAIRLAIVVAVAAIAAPLALTIHSARQSALAAEYRQLGAYARDVLNRTDATADQAAAGVLRLTTLDATPPCSDAELAMMREIDLASSYIQTIGRVVGNQLVCSSLGVHAPPLELGPVDFVSVNRASVRVSVQFPFAAKYRFLVLERDGFAAVIHKSLPIDATTSETNVSLATFLRLGQGRGTRHLTSRGYVDPAWFNRSRESGEAHFIDKGYIVAIADSRKYGTSALAAAPQSNLDLRVRTFAMLQLPIGALAGLVLALTVGYVARMQLAMPALLKAALKQGELFVHYQPIVELATGRWVGAEALVRWRRANGEMVRPDLFIPVAEEFGLIRQITERVLALVTPDMAVLAARGLDVHVSINLSPADLHSPDTLLLLKKMLQATGTKPSNLHVEATERGFIRTDDARRMVDDIRAAGIGVAIDDFGTGYSSLSHLQSFHLDYLKIDKSFVDTVGSEAATSQVVPHIIEMAKGLKLEMIAEGVETEDQANFLRERGVQYAQGWLYSKALPFEELLEGLTTR